MYDIYLDVDLFDSFVFDAEIKFDKIMTSVDRWTHYGILQLSRVRSHDL